MQALAKLVDVKGNGSTDALRRRIKGAIGKMSFPNMQVTFEISA